jgi:16S rRNA (guanine1207-N2)-methyltransferase
MAAETRTRPRPARSRETSAFELLMEGRTLRFETQAGVFSQHEPDEGTLVLLDAALPHVKAHQTVLDLGTGIGIIGVAVAGKLTRGEVWMVDSDVRAVRLAERNVARNGVTNARVVLGDITLDLPPKLRFDLVLSNPPTHSGKQVLTGFVDESHDVLRPSGSLWIVVNRLLSVKEIMAATFDNVEQVTRHHGFIVLRSEKRREGR